ncbi:MAG: flagellar basal body-associated FliL family protein [gamma proteobacterium symbiont of Bathyaustriella thionipta]|nr:flagellar basal body-associated FliL family protein [gamma proteobacterium symbiont of Bathyaustriella thionipta]MCU7950611.1 flagellar basal body-associated FliL family protein [gamma proteobacterium symbiont of Bathyaustriella thionipta]MCU7953957.1 flagellar basal body-associated FliL family protein [gamma proteobacterium symbiont of Bathyaustriella thionipta]MCU7957119.1 flagellar basal body-associated FliL family protein [gamma proteobacterium symbiont of Bathyaustriella thionipta]MCU79
MAVTVLRVLMFVVSIQLIGLDSFFISDAWSKDGLPSQKARFQGMGSTLKEQKKQTLFSSDESEITSKEEIQEEKPGTYFKLHTFVINIRDERYPGKLLFLTLEIFCEIKESDDKWIIETHIAPIKDAIITYTSGLFRQQIQTQKQKKELQEQLAKRVRDVLKTLSGKNVISDLYLTRLIIQ